MSAERTHVALLAPAALADAIGGRLRQEGTCQHIGEICTDTRTLEAGQVYWAIVGDRFDGHQFVSSACEAGASGVVVEAGNAVNVPEGCFVVDVPDSVRALGDLAHQVLQTQRALHPDFQVFALTGSNGKTTTKEMLAAVLRTHRNVLSTAGNYNNWIGLPLTVFRLRPDHDAAVLEMGANAAGEIRRMVEIAEPEVCILTSIAPAHLEGFGSLEGVAKAKREIFESTRARHFVYPETVTRWLREEATDGRAIEVGQSDRCQVRINSVGHSDGGVRGSYSVGEREIAVEIPLLGEHNAWNFGLAIAATQHLAYSPDDYTVAASSLRVPGGRMQQIEYADDVLILQDAYNANPASMKAALGVLKDRAPAEHRLLVLGEMKELGEGGRALHREIGEEAGQLAPRLLFVVGSEPMMAAMAEGATSAGLSRSRIHCVSPGEISLVSEMLATESRPGDVVLLKGSRSNALERVVSALGVRDPDCDDAR